MTRELTPAGCSEYDFVLLLDSSGSMGGGSHRFPGPSLWQEAKESTQGLTDFVSQVDDDGITVITFGGTVQKFDGVTSEKVDEIFTTVQPHGRTPLLGALRACMDKYRSAGKKTIVTVITDGAPDPGSEGDIQSLIIAAANSINDDSDLTFGFVQSGRDAGGRRLPRPTRRRSRESRRQVRRRRLREGRGRRDPQYPAAPGQVPGRLTGREVRPVPLGADLPPATRDRRSMRDVQ